jgi:hypothetical protein
MYVVAARASCTWWLLEYHVRGGCKSMMYMVVVAARA